MTNNQEKVPRITDAEFPRDLPSGSEENFISIICEVDSIYWSFHEGSKKGFAPTVFWTTPHIQEEDRSTTPCLSLTRFLCQHALTYIFGGIDLHEATKESASRAAAKRKVPSMTVFVLSNDPSHEQDISFLFKDIPSRLVRLCNTNFFTAQQLGEITKPLISVGQFAAMYAAKERFGSPTLLFNGGGSAISYIAMDKESKLLGGGAFPGMSIRCRALADYCGKGFPIIDYDTYKEITDKGPISLFARNMEVGVVANATSEVAGQLRNIVKHFLKAVSPSDKPATVVISGEETFMLEQLLKENCSNMVEIEPDVAFPPPSEVSFRSQKNIAFYGIQQLLSANKEEKPPQNPDDEIREGLVGIRITTFDLKSEDSKAMIRGSVDRVIVGKTLEEDTFLVLLDGGGKVVLDLVQLYDAMALYDEVGEETKEENKEDWVGEKREALTKSQAILEGKNDKIKKRKIELDAAKEKDGSLIKTMCREEEVRPNKRPKSDPKKADDIDPLKFVGQRIAKYFDDPTPEDPNHQVIYFGTVDRYSKKTSLWHIKYDDDDEEEFDIGEIRTGVLLYSSNKDNDEAAAS